MRKILYMLFIYCLPLTLWANMAKPYMDGMRHSTLYGSKDCIVSKEYIDITLEEDKEDRSFLAHYKIKYHIISDNQFVLPLVFIGYNNIDFADIIINNKKIKNKVIGDNENLPSFIKKTDLGYSYQYEKGESVHFDDLEHIVYFEAALAKGENIIEVSYTANLEYNTFGFVRYFTNRYALFPSKYWKSFGPIYVSLNLDKKSLFVESNLGKPITENDQQIKWVIDKNIPDELIIKTGPKISLLSKTLLFIDPLGIALICMLAFVYLHWYLLHKYKKRYIFWLGIFIIPIVYFTFYFLAYPLIDYTLNQEYSKHGYYFFIVLTYPLLVIFYGLIFHFVQKRSQNKLKAS